jgi:hypothetical protein
MAIHPVHPWMRSSMVELAGEWGLASLAEAGGNPPTIGLDRVWCALADFDGAMRAALYRPGSPVALGVEAPPTWRDAVEVRQFSLLTLLLEPAPGPTGRTRKVAELFGDDDASDIYAGFIALDELPDSKD